MMDFYGHALRVADERVVHTDSFFRALCVHLNRAPSMKERARQRHALLMTFVRGVFDHPELECVADFLARAPETLELRPQCARHCEALRILVLKHHESFPSAFPASASEAVASVPRALKRAVHTFVLDNLYQGIVTCFMTFAALVSARYHFNVHIFAHASAPATVVPYARELDEEWNRYALYILHKAGGFYLLTPVYVLRSAHSMQHLFELRLTQKEHKSCARIAYFTPPARAGHLVHVCKLDALELSAEQRACIFSVTSSNFKIQLEKPHAVLYIYCARSDTRQAHCVSVYQANNIHVPRFYLNFPQKDDALLLVISEHGQEQADASVEHELNYKIN